MAKKKGMQLGGGGRFAKGVADIESKGESKKEAQAVMAMAGKKRYGAGAMSKMAAKGRARAK